MKTQDEGHASRVWVVTNLSAEHPDDPKQLQIQVTYTGDGNVHKAVALDHQIVPLFKLAPRLLEVVYERVKDNLATMHLTEDEITLVKRLGAQVKGPHT